MAIDVKLKEQVYPKYTSEEIEEKFEFLIDFMLANRKGLERHHSDRRRYTMVAETLETALLWYQSTLD